MDAISILTTENLLIGNSVLIIDENYDVELAKKFIDAGFKDVDLLSFKDFPTATPRGINFIKTTDLSSLKINKLYDVVICTNVLPFQKNIYEVYKNILRLGKICLSTFFGYGHYHTEKFKPLMCNEIQEMLDEITGYEIIYSHKEQFDAVIETKKQPQRTIEFLTKKA